MSIRIRIEGPIPDRRLRTEALAASSEEKEQLIAWGVPDTPSALEEILACDLLICYLPPDDRQCLAFGKRLRDVIARVGAWSYLTQVVVGEPSDDRARRSLDRLRVSGYVHRNASPTDVAKAAFDAWRLSWWYGERLRDVMSLVVNRAGIVIRANSYAERRIAKGPLVGRSYLEVVEGIAQGDLPVDHPILQAIALRKGVSGVRECPGGLERRLFLSCNPLFRLPHLKPKSRSRPDQESHAAVSVLALEMVRWSSIITASNEFARATSYPELFAAIIEHGRRLGFQRVRIYQAEGEKLIGRKAHGFAPGGRAAAEFDKGFSISINEDPTSRDISTRTEPRLYDRRLSVERDTQLEHHISRTDPRLEAFLEKQDTPNWIEAPIFLPPVGSAPPRFWGKLSVDNGREPVDVREIGDVSVFCSVAGLALSMLYRVERQREVRELVAESGQAVLAGTAPEGGEPPTAVSEVLGLYLAMTGGDIALYRRYDKNAPNSLRLDKSPRFRADGRKSGFTIPKVLPCGRSLSGYFRHFRTDELATDDPYVVPDPQRKLTDYLDALGPNRPSDGVASYLRAIRSEMHVPVFSGGKVCGVVVVIGFGESQFDDEHLALVRQYVHPLSIWIEMERRDESRRRMQEALKAITVLLPELANLPLTPEGERQLHAGLAVLLSSHRGLLWNRVLLLCCDAENAPPFTAQLVYAVGGMINDYKEEGRGHSDLQAEVSENPTLGTLESHFRSTLENTVPGHPGRIDTLYARLIVEAQRRGKPIRFGYKPNGNDFWWFLQSGYVDVPNFPVPLTIPFGGVLPKDCFPHFNGQNLGEQVFSEKVETYIYPLWSAFDLCPRPLGCVLVDIPGRCDGVLLEDMRETTRVVLGLVSDILALRHLKWVLGDWIDSLPLVDHREYLSHLWDNLRPEISRILDAIGPAKTDAEVIDSVRILASPRALEVLRANLKAVTNKIPRLTRKPVASDWIADMFTHCQRLAENFPSTIDANLKVTLIGETSLRNKRFPISALVFKTMLESLLENSRNANLGAPSPVEVSIRVWWLEKQTCETFAGFFHILYEEKGGAGIHKDDADYVTIHGYSKSGGKKAGRGLAFLTDILNNHHSSLEFRRGLDNPIRENDTIEAKFEIRVGVLKG